MPMTNPLTHALSVPYAVCISSILVKRRINSLFVTNIESPSWVKVYDNSLVYVSLLHSKLVNVDVLSYFQRRRRAVAFKTNGMYILHYIPRYIQVACHILQRQSQQKAHDILGKVVGVRVDAYILLLVVATFLIIELVTLHLHADNYLISSYWETYKVYHSVTVHDIMVLSAFWTYRQSSFTLDMQNKPDCLLFYLVSLPSIDRWLGY